MPSHHRRSFVATLLFLMASVLRAGVPIRDSSLELSLPSFDPDFDPDFKPPFDKTLLTYSAMGDAFREEMELTDVQETAKIKARQHRLLSVGNVINPIPDQIADINTGVDLPLGGVFTPGYDMLSVSTLPSWLNLNYKQLASLPTGGTAYTTVIHGDEAFVAAGTSWQIYNTTDFTQIASITVPSGGTALSIAVTSDGAYTAVSAGTAGTLIYDISASTPVLRSTYSAGTGTAQAVLFSPDGNTMYAANDLAGVDIVNVTSKSNPSKIVTIPPGSGYAEGLALYNHLLAAAMLSDGTYLWDISNPASPIQVSRIAGRALAATFSETGTELVISGQGNGATKFDISTPSTPVLLGNYPSGSGAGGSVVGTNLVGNTLLVADYSLGVALVDTSTSNFTFLGSQAAGGGTSYGITLDTAGNLWISNGGAGVMVFDPRQASLVGSPPALLGQHYPVTVSSRSFTGTLSSDSFTLTLDYPPSLGQVTWPDRSVNPGYRLSQILDSSLLFTQTVPSLLQLSLEQADGELAPAFFNLQLAPLTVGNYQALARKVTVSGQNLLVTALNTAIFNITTMSLQGTITGSGTYEVLVSPSGTLVFSIDNHAIRAFNMSTGTPVLMSTTTVTGQNYEAALSGDSLFVANVPLGLQKFNVSNSSNLTLSAIYPGATDYIAVSSDGRIFTVILTGIQALSPSLQPLGNISSPTSINQLLISEQIIYALASDALKVYDVNTFQSLGSYSTTSSPPAGLAASGHILIICDGPFARFLDVSNSSQPRSLGIFPAPGSDGFSDVAISGTNAFFAAGSSGVVAADLTRWLLTANPSNGDEGNYQIKLTARDSNGGSFSTTATWRVEGPPRVNGSFPLQQLWVGQLTSILIPEGLVTDPNFDPISFSLLPNNYSWFGFNSYASTFFVTPPSSAVGIMSVSVSATDHISGSVTFVVPARVSYLPVVNQRIPTQAVGIGLTYQLTIPSATFYNSNQGSLVYSIQGLSGQALPSWLSFNGTTLLGIPGMSDAGTETVIVTATNQYGGQASTDLSLVVENFPSVAQTISAAVAGIGQTFTMTVPPDTFVSSNSLTYSTQQVLTGGSLISLPGWLGFDPTTRTFSGVAPSASVTTVRVIATDPNGGSAYTDFSLTARQFPLVATPIPTPPALTVGLPFRYQVPSDTFNEFGLTYTASLAGGGALPTWLSFDPITRTFSGTPPTTAASNLALQVLASDGQGGSVSAPVTLVVVPNLTPEVSLPISNQEASVGQEFTLFVGNTFRDPNPNDTIRLTAQYTAGWLKFDPTTSTFSGTPSQGDTDAFTAHIINVLFQASDHSNATATMEFIIAVGGTSAWALFLKIAGPLTPILLFLLRNRINTINRCRKNRYGDPLVFRAGQPYKSPELTQNHRDKILVKWQKNSNSSWKFWQSVHEPLDGNGKEFPLGLQRRGNRLVGTLGEEEAYLDRIPEEKPTFANMAGKQVVTIKTNDSWFLRGLIRKQYPLYLIRAGQTELPDIEKGTDRSRLIEGELPSPSTTGVEMFNMDVS